MQGVYVFQCWKMSISGTGSFNITIILGWGFADGELVLRLGTMEVVCSRDVFYFSAVLFLRLPTRPSNISEITYMLTCITLFHIFTPKTERYHGRWMDTFTVVYWFLVSRMSPSYLRKESEQFFLFFVWTFQEY